MRRGTHRQAAPPGTKPQRQQRTVLARASASRGEPCRHDIMLFSYGANLSPAVLQKRGVWPLNQAVPAVAPPDAVLSFCHGGGFATVDYASHTAVSNPSVSRCVDAAGFTAAQQPIADADAASELCSIAQPHGMLYSVSDAQLAELSKRETGYRLAVIPVTPYGVATAVDAHVFVSSCMLRLRKPVPPTQRYLDLILSGARSWQLSEAYIGQLESVPIAKPGGLTAEYFDTPSASVAAAAVAGAALAAASLLFWRARAVK